MIEWTVLSPAPEGHVDIYVTDCDVCNIGGQFVVRRQLPDNSFVFMTAGGVARTFATADEACAAVLEAGA